MVRKIMCRNKGNLNSRINVLVLYWSLEGNLLGYGNGMVVFFSCHRASKYTADKHLLFCRKCTKEDITHVKKNKKTLDFFYLIYMRPNKPLMQHWRIQERSLKIFTVWSEMTQLTHFFWDDANSVCTVHFLHNWKSSKTYDHSFIPSFAKWRNSK